jgi:drug/metabolite transporter (DMT)-like permease
LVIVWMRGVLQAILVGFFAALLAALCYGGIDVLQHYLLRAILAIKRYSPFNYPGLLEHTTRLIFTQKVGAGYIFIHRFLLEHFAATTSPKREAKGSSLLLTLIQL